MSFEYIRSKRGQQMILLNNFKYRFAYKAIQTGNIRWRCFVKECKGTIHVNELDEIIDQTDRQVEDQFGGNEKTTLFRFGGNDTVNFGGNDERPQFDKVKILNKESHFSKRMYKEAIEIEKCPENFNREDGWKIRKT
ncbi:uncharacterized protein LOC126895570 isoform X2 [Daktulosphaira vitifoliae]|uniref:uncharacterized protein LOC126895570 isoform X2 n=1 Tax=Daktulosphaira vitifoliae TaxID=58002 RepID=UPI0021AA20D7|nr:uncharacterized protein LOC126895570 isoform X2 [Daktulosphaira vitifoliae]